MNSKLNSIAYICVFTSNMEESIRFYRDILNLEPHQTKDNIEGTTFFSFKTGETTLALEPNGTRKETMKDKSEMTALIQFKAESEEQLEQINKDLESKGVKLVDRSTKRSYGTITNFSDPDGNYIQLMTPWEMPEEK